MALEKRSFNNTIEELVCFNIQDPSEGVHCALIGYMQELDCGFRATSKCKVFNQHNSLSLQQLASSIRTKLPTFCIYLILTWTFSFLRRRMPWYIQEVLF